jgi:hypothetical protein
VKPEPIVPEETITCIDCGGRCHLLTTWPDDDPPQPGDVMTYRCEDCNDRWDLLLPGAEEPDDPADNGTWPPR